MTSADNSFNLAALQEAIAEALPERECLVFRDRRFTWSQVTERTRRFANHMLAQGLGHHADRAGLSNWESGQDHVALYLHNGNEYLECMLGAFKSRTVPFNVNYRYVEEELIYLLDNAQAKAIVYHARFAPMLRTLLPKLPQLKVLVQVQDDSGEPLLPGAVEYEAALAAASPERPDVEWSPDDLYMLYTGGTTGMPKGVLWRQADVFTAALGGRRKDGTPFESVEQVVERVETGRGVRLCPPPPMMHGAAHWGAFHTWHGGGTVIIQGEVLRFDAADLWATVEREKVQALLIVGDAFGRPIADALEQGDYDISSLKVLTNSGAALSADVKQRMLDLHPPLRIVDAMGSSESGQQGRHISEGGKVSTGMFEPAPGACVLSADLERVLAPGDDETGWFAQQGYVPLGYLGDEDKTRRTFPVVEGKRYSVPGDRARWQASGMVELLGRDSVTINSGGEKIFAEEVEAALKHHEAVYDAIVCGRPSERWGQEVCAVVQLAEGRDAQTADLLAECEKHIARYKLPKQLRMVGTIERNPSGKPDYRWARAQFPD